MRLGTKGFQYQRLTQVRECREMTQTALGQMINKTAATISRWESGEQLPEAESVKELSQVLRVPASFFMNFQPDYGTSPPFFRSMASATGTLRKRVEARLRWAQEISAVLQKYIDLPTMTLNSIDAQNYQDISYQDIEKIAQECRRLWMIGNGPISDLLLAMENSGIITIKDELGVKNMDGVSCWCKIDGRGYILIAKDKNTCTRSRMDAAHELGHLVLHKHIKSEKLSNKSDFKEIEKQAFYFAGAFLMPAETFGAEISSPSLDTFVALKGRWKTSVGAMIKRCENLKIINEDYNTRLWKYYSARGWRKEEPLDNEMEIEKPKLLHRSFDLLLGENVRSIDQLINEIRLPSIDIENLANLPTGYLSGKKADVVEFPKIKPMYASKQPAALKSDTDGAAKIISFNKDKN